MVSEKSRNRFCLVLIIISRIVTVLRVILRTNEVESRVRKGGFIAQVKSWIPPNNFSEKWHTSLHVHSVVYIFLELP